MIWKVEAMGDTVYVDGKDFHDAEMKFFASFGEVPNSIMKWTQVDKLPEGEELIADAGR